MDSSNSSIDKHALSRLQACDMLRESTSNFNKIWNTSTKFGDPAQLKILTEYFKEFADSLIEEDKDKLHGELRNFMEKVRYKFKMSWGNYEEFTAKESSWLSECVVPAGKYQQGATYMPYNTGRPKKLFEDKSKTCLNEERAAIRLDTDYNFSLLGHQALLCFR